MMQETKCLDTLDWFIAKSKKDKWTLWYDQNLDKRIFGIIVPDDVYVAWNFIPVLHGGSYVYGVKIKS